VILRWACPFWHLPREAAGHEDRYVCRCGRSAVPFDLPEVVFHGIMGTTTIFQKVSFRLPAEIRW
jgi:hypothetical protein